MSQDHLFGTKGEISSTSRDKNSFSTMFQKSEGCTQTQTALDFELQVEAVAKKIHFKNFSVT